MTDATISADELRAVANNFERSAEANRRSRADADEVEARNYFDGKTAAYQAAAVHLRQIADEAAPQPRSDCQHPGCDGDLLGPSDDPLLPEYIDVYECARCGEVYEHDTEDDRFVVSI